MFNHLHYLPLPLPFFVVLAAIFLILLVLLQVGVLRYAYRHLRINSGAALLLLAGTLFGGCFNIPVVELSARKILSGHQIVVQGMHYLMPAVAAPPETVIAVNVGGALIPVLMSLYLISRHHLWTRGFVAIACVAAVCHLVARPSSEVGVSLPVLVPVISSAFVALVLSRRLAAPLAYIGGSVGTLIGADLLNIGNIQALGAPIASIGGAGTFDGIFLTGVLAVLFASLRTSPECQRHGRDLHEP